MEKFFKLIKDTQLFKGGTETEIEKILKCLTAQRRRYDKNDFILRAGDSVGSVGMVILGSVHIIKEDFWGNRSIIAKLGVGDLFAEAFAFAEVDVLPVSVVATERTEILFLDYRKIINNCPLRCTVHDKLIHNMLKIFASKNVLLTQKMEHITKRTTREKLMSYLSLQANKNRGNEFNITFNRQELADYLSVDRSAMSNELSKMRREGILNFRGNHFELILK